MNMERLSISLKFPATILWGFHSISLAFSALKNAHIFYSLDVVHDISFLIPFLNIQNTRDLVQTLCPATFMDFSIHSNIRTDSLAFLHMRTCLLSIKTGSSSSLVLVLVGIQEVTWDPDGG